MHRLRYHFWHYDRGLTNEYGLVLADDATGALECASLLAGLQLRVTITLAGLGLFSPAAEGIHVVDTESRHVPAAVAAEGLRPLLETARRHVFKKTDSTLRGNIAAELLAMLDAPGGRPVVYVPAYPALGRTVAAGHLLVNGVPVAETEFARDAREAVHTSRIADLFPLAARHRVAEVTDACSLSAALRDPTPRILICDAASARDMAAIAEALRDAGVWVAGPAGFIGAWAGLGDFPIAAPPAVSAPRKWLVVCGSRHPRSRRQAQIAADDGLAVLRTPDTMAGPPDEAAAALARRAAAFIRDEAPDALLIMGGDTALAICRALDISTLTALPEAMPGAAACFSAERGLLLVTKAGGFGDDRLVANILESCNRT